MRKCIHSFCFLLLFCFTIQGQDLSTALNQYFAHLEKKEISEALDLVHPSIINMLGKETFVQQYEELFNSPGIGVVMSNFSIDSLSAVHSYENEQYQLVDYSFRMVFAVDVSKDESGFLSDVLLSSYQGKFGKDNVTSDEPGVYFIKIQRELFAVQSPSFQGWKILDFEEGMRDLIVDIVPEEVLKHFKR